MSRVTAIISALVICIIVCLSWAVNHYRITPLPTKPVRQKCQRTEAANAAITDMQMRQRDVAALDAKYTKELKADAKAENDALRDDAGYWPSSQRTAVCHRASGSHHRLRRGYAPGLADTAERDYFTLRERLTTMQKQLKEPRSILMSSADRAAHIDKQLMQLL